MAPARPLRELLLDADPDERRIADHLAHGELFTSQKLRDCRRSHCYPSDGETYMGNHELPVAPEYRRQHCGTALVRHALDIIRNKGGRYAEVGTSDASPGPMALYESCGFQISGVINNHFTDNYPEPVWDNGVQCIDMIRMRADLSLRKKGAHHAAQKA